MNAPAPESLTIRPAAADWRDLVHRNASPDAALIRRELGLATDRLIIMTGHQAEFWHPGILAKYLATDAASVALNAQPAWLVVDQDRAESANLRYPTRTNGRLSIGTATVRERSVSTTNGSIEAGIQQRRDAALAALQSHTSGPLPRRIAATLADLMSPLLSLPAPTLFATDLNRTTLFQSLVENMRRDPEACILAYNAAARLHPSAGIRPLIADDIQDRWELPLWHLPPGKPRTHVYAEMTVPVSELAPKALFMTGLMRLAACDLFIHGTGGGGGGGNDDDSHDGYDLITEEWLERWLGVPRARLAPMAVVTATRYLPLSTEPPPSPADVARAIVKAHRARHSPELLGDHAGAIRKQALVHEIAAAPHHSHQRADLFREMHRILEAIRRAHASALDELDHTADQLKARLSERNIAFDRTWPFALYPQSTLRELRDRIYAEFNSPR